MAKRLAERRLSLEVTDAAKEHLALAGFDPVYGARPLKRAIQKEIENPLALKLIEGSFREGDAIRVVYLSFTDTSSTDRSVCQDALLFYRTSGLQVAQSIPSTSTSDL